MYQKQIKRLLDFILSLSSIILVSPLMTVISALIRIRLGRPVLFRQKRPGYQEKLFVLYKFRTMANKRDKKGRLLPDEKRLTKFGRMLRSTSMDELPELLNVLKGDMSMVGPRPLLVRYLPYYRKEERLRSTVKPGMTGLAQVNGRNALSWEERFRLDVEYVRKLSFRLDLKILLKTVTAVWKRKDILVGEEHVLKDLDAERKGEDKNNSGPDPPGEPVRIRLLTETDLAAHEGVLKDFLKQNMRINFPERSDFDEYVLSSWQNMCDCLGNGSAIVIGALSGKRLLGFLWAYPREFLGERRIHISHVIVSEEERSRGLGTGLLLFLEELAKNENIKKLELIASAGNQNTLEFYEAKGYQITRVHMEKDL